MPLLIALSVVWLVWHFFIQGKSQISPTLGAETKSDADFLIGGAAVEPTVAALHPGDWLFDQVTKLSKGGESRTAYFLGADGKTAVDANGIEFPNASPRPS
jgi:hypothetical protein